MKNTNQSIIVILSVFYLTLFAIHAQAQNQEPQLFNRGYGNKSCADFIEVRRKNDIFEINSYLQYIQGFINGAEIQRLWNKQTKIENVSGNTILLMAESYCMQEPQSDMIFIATKITSKLVQK